MTYLTFAKAAASVTPLGHHLDFMSLKSKSTTHQSTPACTSPIDLSRLIEIFVKCQPLFTKSNESKYELCSKTKSKEFSKNN